MKRVYVIDNGGQWTHRIWRVLRELDCESKIIPNTTPLDQIDASGLVLSGGAPRIAWENLKLGSCTDYLAQFSGPILGVCVGHQLMAVYYGGKAGPSEIPEFGLCNIKVIEPDDLFKGLPSEFQVWQSHNDEVKEAGEFITLAGSKDCKIQAIKHKTKPHYGIQFHAEVNDTEHGEQIYQNFVNLIK
ncbi:MAG: GMP synthase subunit A [Candidatus Brocadiia bacterium]